MSDQEAGQQLPERCIKVIDDWCNEHRVLPNDCWQLKHRLQSAMARGEPTPLRLVDGATEDAAKVRQSQSLADNRKAVIEECAKVAEQMDDGGVWGSACPSVARVIRSLKSPPSGGETG